MTSPLITALNFTQEVIIIFDYSFIDILQTTRVLGGGGDKTSFFGEKNVGNVMKTQKKEYIVVEGFPSCGSEGRGGGGFEGVAGRI